MNFEELLEYLDLDEAAEFEYFEAMADLLECEDYIDSDAMYKLFEGADKETTAGLLDDYFEDIMEGLPENSGEIYSLLEQIKMTLMGMLKSIEDENDIRRFSDEFYKFQTWYSHESEVELSPEGAGADMYCNVRDAITASRMEKLGGDKYRYDFENALTYELDSYTMSFADLVSAELGDENDGTIVYSPDDPEDEQYR